MKHKIHKLLKEILIQIKFIKMKKGYKRFQLLKNLNGFIQLKLGLQDIKWINTGPTQAVV